MTNYSNGFDFVKFMDSIADRTVSFLKDEIKIDINKIEKDFIKESSVELKDFTVFISFLSSMNKISVSHSFDQSLINSICKSYCSDLDINEDELYDYVKETADDMINIIVGNSMPNVDNKTGAIHITPPMIISNAKNISSKKTISFFVKGLSTDHGDMKIICAISNGA